MAFHFGTIGSGKAIHLINPGHGSPACATRGDVHPIYADAPTCKRCIAVLDAPGVRERLAEVPTDLSEEHEAEERASQAETEPIPGTLGPDVPMADWEREILHANLPSDARLTDPVETAIAAESHAHVVEILTEAPSPTPSPLAVFLQMDFQGHHIPTELELVLQEIMVAVPEYTPEGQLIIRRCTDRMHRYHFVGLPIEGQHWVPNVWGIVCQSPTGRWVVTRSTDYAPEKVAPAKSSYGR